MSAWLKGKPVSTGAPLWVQSMSGLDCYAGYGSPFSTLRPSMPAVTRLASIAAAHSKMSSSGARQTMLSRPTRPNRSATLLCPLFVPLLLSGIILQTHQACP